jgi:hypothetical protein
MALVFKIFSKSSVTNVVSIDKQLSDIETIDLEMEDVLFPTQETAVVVFPDIEMAACDSLEPEMSDFVSQEPSKTAAISIQQGITEAFPLATEMAETPFQDTEIKPVTPSPQTPEMAATLPPVETMGEFAYSSDSVYTFSTSPSPIQNQTYVTKVDEM